MLGSFLHLRDPILLILMLKTSATYKKSVVLTDHLQAVLVGLLLGDANMQTFSKTGKTWRVRLLQGEINLEYLRHLRTILDEFTNMEIASNHEVRANGKEYRKWFFNTLSFEQFAELGNSFYPLISGSTSRVKVLPAQLEDWITEVSLVYWFMDDGSKKWGNKVISIRFCTDSYTEQEVDRLIEILYLKFNLQCTKNRDDKGWRIYVSTVSYDRAYSLIYPLLHSSMLYKFPIKT